MSDKKFVQGRFPNAKIFQEPGGNYLVYIDDYAPAEEYVLPETFDKENDIYILNSEDYKSSYSSRDYSSDPSTNECFNHFLIYLDEIVDETFAHFKYGESFESSGYKTKSEWKKDIQTHKDLCLGNYKCRNQKYASDIEQWVEIGCFPKKELTMLNIPRGTKLWIVWNEHTL